jgi:hypothetical protein
MSWILKALGEWMMGKALAVVFSVGTSEHWLSCTLPTRDEPQHWLDCTTVTLAPRKWPCAIDRDPPEVGTPVSDPSYYGVVPNSEAHTFIQ